MERGLLVVQREKDDKDQERKTAPFQRHAHLKVQVHWRGFEEGDKICEPLENLIADVPKIVKISSRYFEY